VTPDSVTIAFLDANIIAKPLTRTLLMLGATRSGFVIVWSATAEAEATRHMRGLAMPPAEVRRIYGGELAPTGDLAGRFTATKAPDRQILADSQAAGARFLITEDVDDFAETDLVELGISAVNPDLFMSVRMTREAYVFALEVLERTRSNPTRSIEQIHAGIARRHPRLFAAHSDLWNVPPDRSAHAEPKVIFRGARCLRSERIVDDPGLLVDGVAPESL
jgi:hypothetical protein